MSNHENLESEPQKEPETKTEVDRYERLQLSAERQLEKVSTAYERHSSLIMRSVIVIVAVLGGLGTFFFFHDIGGFKTEIRETIGLAVTNAQSRAELEFVHMTNRVEVKIAEAQQKIDDAINQKFLEQNINPVIESNVQRRVSTITDKIIEDSIRKQIEPRLLQITNEMATVEAQIDDAKNSVTTINDVANLTMTIVAALNNDRYAFDKLVQMRNSGTNQYAATILNAINAITTKLSDETSPLWTHDLDWNIYNFDPNKATWYGYVEMFSKVGQMEQEILVQKISQQTRFPQILKLDVYRDLIMKTPSLMTIARVTAIVNNQSHQNMNILGSPSYLEWIESQLHALSMTNYTEMVGTNCQDPSIYADLGRVYGRNNNFTNAMDTFKKAVELFPKDTFVNNGFAWFLATAPDDSVRNGKYAVELALKACESSNWKNSGTVDTLAAAYAEMGNFEKAIKYQKQVLEMGGFDDEYRAKAKHRLSLYEQHKPFRDLPE